MQMNAEPIYLFCFARSDLLHTIEGTGVDGRSSLFLLPYREIVAVLSMVALEEFQGETAETRMHDLAWLGPRACRHEEVVERAMCHSPVMPVRLGTVFHSLARLEDRLKKHYDAIRLFLDQVCDKEEWSVKGFLDEKEAGRKYYSRMLDVRAGQLSSSAGMRYLQEQRLRAESEKELRRRLKEVCQDVAGDLDLIAVDSCVRNVLHGESTGNDRVMIVNWAFLVPRSAVAQFRMLIERANAQCQPLELVFVLSGPWPPYSFCPVLEEVLQA